jgi:orotate phosphoribosyltransferase
MTDPQLAADVDACCRLTGEFTLRSGQVASEYFDKYLFESDPQLLARVVAQMSDLLPEGTELLGGLELGGVPIVTVLSARVGLPALFVRKKAKDYGTCKLAEGPDVAGRRITLVEDVITTGGAVRDATTALREAGATVEVVVCAIDRSPAGENPLADVGLEVRPVLTKAELDAARAAAV